MLATMLTLSCIFLGPVGEFQDLAGRVGRLVRQLDDDRLAERNAAERALTALGPAALEYIPQGSAASPEVKERLSRVRKVLQTEFARRSVEASRVTLQGDMSLADALRAIEKQTENRIVGFERVERQVVVDFDAVPFWEALDQLLDQARLSVFSFAGARRAISVVPRPEDQSGRSGRACYGGLFRFQATQISAVRDLRNPSIAGLRVRMAIAWEPRITPISLTQPLSDIAALDDLDRLVPVDGADGSLNVAVESDYSSVEIELPLRLPDRSARRIASLRGNLIALMPGRIEEFRFTNLEESDQELQRRASVVVTRERVRENDEIHEVPIRVRFDEAGEAFESHRGWILKNEAFAVDSTGQRVESVRCRVTSRSEREIVIAYQFAFQQPVQDYSFVYRTPSLVLRQGIPYELTDIELP